MEDYAIKLAAGLILAEAERASGQHAPMVSAHEGLGVIDEEWHELKLEIYKNPLKLPGGAAEYKSLMRAEAIQLGAMALRFIVDVCGVE